MQANEIIELIKALSPEEQAKVFEFVDQSRWTLQESRSLQNDFASASDWVFQEHAELMQRLSQ